MRARTSRADESYSLFYDESAASQRPGDPGPPGLLDDPAEDEWLDQPAPLSLLYDPAADRWPDAPVPPGVLDELAGYGWPAEPASPPLVADPAAYGWPADLPAHDDPPAGSARLAQAGQRWLDLVARHPWYAAAARHRWLTALGAGGLVMALAGGALLITPHGSPAAMTNGCGSVPCRIMRATSAAPQPTTGTPASAMARQPAAMPTTMPATAPASTAPPTMAFSSTAPAAMATVRYAVVLAWSGGLIGEFTITNNGSTDISGWELAAAFPGDQIEFTDGANDPELGSSILTLQVPSSGPVIAPGASQSVIFTANGPTDYPVGCTFNGMVCM